MSQVVDLTESVESPSAPPARVVEAAFLPVTSAVTLGIVRASSNAFTLGPVELLRFGAPETTEDGVRWPILGGLLAAGPGGFVGFSWRDGRLTGSLRGYRPSLPGLVYKLTQKQVHHLVTRLFLLQLRGRDPLPGSAATRQARTVATAIDLALCLSLGRLSLRRTLAITALYHVGCWAAFGQTLGARLMDIRIVSVDGSQVTPGQALARLLGDDFAGTAVIEDQVFRD